MHGSTPVVHTTVTMILLPSTRALRSSAGTEWMSIAWPGLGTTGFAPTTGAGSTLGAALIGASEGGWLGLGPELLLDVCVEAEAADALHVAGARAEAEAVQNVRDALLLRQPLRLRRLPRHLLLLRVSVRDGL